MLFYILSFFLLFSIDILYLLLIVLSGISLLLKDSCNVIVCNLVIFNIKIDVIIIQNGCFIWFDYLDILVLGGKFFGIISGSDYILVSYNKFYGFLYVFDLVVVIGYLYSSVFEDNDKFYIIFVRNYFVNVINVLLF